MKKCSNCQCQMEDDLLFCPSCGQAVSLAEPAKGKKSKKKWIVLTAILLVCAIACGVVLTCLPGGDDEFLWSGVYYDGDDWYIRTSVMEEPLRFEVVKSWEDYLDAYSKKAMRLSPDGKYLVYFESEALGTNDDLYYASLSELDQKPVKLTGDGQYAYFTHESDCVYFLTNKGRLYRYVFSTGEEEEIAKDVTADRLDNGIRIQADDELHLFIADDGYTVELPTEMDVDWESAHQAFVYRDGSILFSVRNASADLSVFFEDDLRNRVEADALLKTLSAQPCVTLYRYKEDKLTKLADLFKEGSDSSPIYDFANDTAAAMFYAPVQGHKIPLSALREANGNYLPIDKGAASVEKGVLRKVLDEHSSLHVVQGEQSAYLSCDKHQRMGIGPDGSFVFGFTEQKGSCSLSVYAWENGVLKETDLSSTVVSDFKIFGNYFLHEKDGQLHLYGQEAPFEGAYSIYEVMNRGEKVTKLYIENDYAVCPVTGALYYLVDEELRSFSDGKTSVICDGVSQWTVCGDGTVCLLSDDICMVYTQGELVTVYENAENIAPIYVGGYIWSW